MPTSVRVEPEYVEVVDGAEQQLSATVIDELGRPFDPLPEWIRIEWGSSDTAVAVVSDSGVVTAVAPGTAAIEAVVWTADAIGAGQAASPAGRRGPKGTSEVRVRGRARELRYVAGNEQRGAVGTELPDSLVVQAVDKNGRGVARVPVEFVVTAGGGESSPASAETGPSGYARAGWRLGPAEGEQRLEARVAGLTGSPVAFTANAGAPAARVEIAPESVEMSAVGDTARLSAAAYDEEGATIPDAAFRWSSLDPAVASVDDGGVVEALAAGAARIVARADAASDTATVVVDPVVSEVVVTPAVDTLAVEEAVQLTAEARDANGHEIAEAEFEWASSDTAVAKVDASGRVVGVAEGTAAITASSGDESGAAAITVASNVRDPDVVRVEVSPGAGTMDALGATIELAATAYDTDGIIVSGVTIDWASLDTDVVTVDASGVAIAQGVGQALVVAAAACCAAADTAVIEVRQLVAAVAVTPGDATVDEGSSVELGASASDANGHAIPNATFAWSSSNEGVATVDDGGRVTGVAEGTASVVATSESAADTAVVTVEAGGGTSVPGGAGGPNEPPGFDAVFYVDGTTKDWGGQFSYGRKWGDRSEGSSGPFTGRVSVVNDSEAPNGRAVQVAWHAGDPSGFAGAAFWNDWTGSVGHLREIYIKVIVKYSANWDQHSSGTTKLFYYGAGSGGASEFYPQMNGGPNPGLLRWRDQSGTGDDGVFRAEDDGAFSAGRYHTLEIHHIAQSSPGASDGSVRVWIDGKEIDSWAWLGDGRTVRLSEPNYSWLGNESEVRFTGVQLGTYWGGSNDTKDVNDWMRWGEIYISGKR